MLDSKLYNEERHSSGSGAANVDSSAKEMGLLVKNVDVQQSFYLGELFAKFGFSSVLRSDVRRVEANGVDPVMRGEEDGTLVVEVLGNDGDIVLAKDFFDTDDRVQCAEAGIIQVDAISGNAFFDEGVFHVGGLVVALRVVVAADDQVVDFIVKEKTCGGAHAIFEIGIGVTTHDFFGTAEDKGDMAMRDRGYIRVGLIVGCAGDDESGGEERKEAESQKGGERDENFSPHKSPWYSGIAEVGARFAAGISKRLRFR